VARFYTFAMFISLYVLKLLYY